MTGAGALVVVVVHDRVVVDCLLLETFPVNGGVLSFRKDGVSCRMRSRLRQLLSYTIVKGRHSP